MTSALLLLLAAAPSAHALDILLLDDGGDDTPDLYAELVAWGHTVTLSSDDGYYEDDFDGSIYTLSDYDALIWLDGYPSYSYNMDDDGQRAIKEWVKAGGGLLHFGGTGWSYDSYDHNKHAKDVIPLRENSDSSDRVYECADDTHPVAAGFSNGDSFTAEGLSIRDSSPSFGDSVFTFDRWGTTYSAIAAGTVTSGRVVQFSLFGNTYYSSYQAEWDDSDISQLTENSIQWLVIRAPVADIDGSGSVTAGGVSTLDGSGSYDPDGGDLVSYSWDESADGSSDGSGDSYSFDATGLDGPVSVELELTVTDDEGDTGTATATVSVANADPVIASAPAVSGLVEGSTGGFAVAYSDAESADTHTIEWDFGDGDVGTGATARHVYVDDGTYTVSVVVTDDDGGSDSTTFSQTVTNAAPTLLGTPDTSVFEGETYTFSPTATDPGTDDVLTWAFSGHASPSFDTGSGALSWSPAYADLGDHSLEITVSDGDGGSDSVAWVLTVNMLDDDGDGMSDIWEADMGLDPTDPSDASGDPDADGRSNLVEFEGGSDPGVYDGPGSPTLLSPDNASEVDVASPTLVVGAASAPLLQELSYGFTIYEDAALSVLVSDTTGVAASTTGAEWTVELGLDENTWYWWDATAADDYVTGAVASPARSFFVNTVNDPPEVPELVSPFEGATASTLTPTFEASVPADPDLDAVTLSVRLTDAGGALLAEADGEAGVSSVVTWTPDVTLSDETEYCWTAFAVDEHGLEGLSAEPACFFVDLYNDPPSAPSWIAPTEGAVVAAGGLELMVDNGVDPEGRATVHVFQLDSSDSFASADLVEERVRSGDDGTTSWLPDLLPEDSTWNARVRCEDGDEVSDWVAVQFMVSSDNDPPSVPELVTPSQGQDRAGAAFVMGGAVDPEGTAITYEAAVFDRSGEQLMGVQGLAEQNGEATWSASEIAEGVYTWTSRAVDADGLASEWAPAAVFSVGGGAPPSDDGGDLAGVGDLNMDAVAGCGCASAPSGGRSGGALVLLGFGALGAMVRRRRG